MMKNKPSMNPALRDFWLTPSRYKILYGGRASGKTWDTAAHVVRISRSMRIRVLCARQFQNKIEESVYHTIRKQVERFGLEHEFTFTQSKIRHNITGSEFIFYGIARNIAEIKGLEDIDILWLEEAEAVSQEDYGILEATIRKANSEIFIVFNPRNIDDFIYQEFVVNPPDNALVRKINYDENPFLSDTALEDVDRLKRRDPDEFKFRYLGVPRSNNERAIIKLDWLESAKDAHIKLGITPSGMKRIGFDIADDGGDMNATAATHGQLCLHVEKWKGLEDELLKSATRVYDLAVERGASIDYDSIGVGAMAGAKFKELNQSKGGRVPFRKFNAGAAVIRPDDIYMPGVTNKDHFENLKAQAWWSVADRLLKTHLWVTQGEKCKPSEIISLDSGMDNLDALIAELSTPWRDFGPSGKVKVESKKDLAKRGVKSPNMADAFIMAYSPINAGSFNWSAVSG